jgi:penicillin-binding protein 1B
MRPLGPVPDGVEVLRIDRASDLVADDTCPSDSISAAFLVGTAPDSTCSHMGEDSQTLGNRIFDLSGTPGTPNPNPNVPTTGAAPNAVSPDSSTDPAKHRNFFQKLFGTGKQPTTPQPATPQPVPPLGTQPGTKPPQ